MNDGSFNVETGSWTVNIPSNAIYLLAIHGQITETSVKSTVNQISQDVYNPYGSDNAKPKVLLVFDDGNVAQYNIAFRYMQSKGIVGTAYINGYNIGQSGVLTLSNILEMNAAGWIIANHAYDHQNFYLLTDQEILNEISEQINFLVSNGLTNGAYHLSYPGGYSNQNVYDIMNDLGIKTGRSLSEIFVDNLNALNLYQIPAYTIINTTSVSTLKGYVDNAITTDSTVILLFHNIKDSNPSTYEYLTSDFKSIVDYISNTGIECLTINDLYQHATVAPINIPSNRTVTNTGQSTSKGFATATASLTTSEPVADVSVTQTTSNNNPNYLEDVTFTINITNLGPSAAENVTVGYWLNENYLTWVSDDSGGSYNPQTGIWTIGTLNSGATITLNIIAKIIGSNDETIITRATYNSGTTYDPNPDNNYQNITITPVIPKADIEITNSASNYTPNYLDNITLTVKVKNNGPNTAENVSAGYWLNGNYLTWVSDDSGGSYNPQTGIWTIGTLNSGATITLNIIAKIIGSNDETIITRATYNSGTTYDPNPDNNYQNITITPVIPTADIEITNSASNYTPNYLDNITLTVKVKNNGPNTAENVSAGDWLNGNYLTWVSDDSGGSYNPQTGIWTIGTLNSGATITLNIIAKIIASNGGTLINSATYNSGTTYDPNPDNNLQNITLTISTLTPTAIVVNPANGVKGDTVDLIATLTDTHVNLPLEDKTIQFSVNGIPVGTAKTNAQGIAKYAYTITENFGTYTILAEFLEDTTYAASNNTNNLNIARHTNSNNCKPCKWIKRRHN